MTELGSLVARLYFDEDADARLARALRRRDYDVETTVEAGLLEASDEEQLTLCCQPAAQGVAYVDPRCAVVVSLQLCTPPCKKISS